MRRLSLAMRLALIVAGAMLVVQLLALGVQLSREDDLSFAGVRPSFAREMAGLARLLDRLPPLRRAIALEVVNAGQYTVSIASRMPARDDGGPLYRLSAAAIGKRIAEAGVPADSLEVNYLPGPPDGGTSSGPLQRLLGRHLQVAIALPHGGVMVVDPNSDVNSGIFANFLAIGAAVLGLVVVALTVYAVLRETRPLARLAGNIETFAHTAVPREMEERGAPELRSLIRATNAMQQQIATLIRNRTLILAGMSHDLRTEVTRLRLRLELLPEGPGRDGAIADLETMQALIEQTLDYAGGDSSVEGGRADVAAVLGQLAATYPADRFTWSGEGPAWVAMAETPLRRVLKNLVDNAIAYGKVAEVSVSAAGGTVRIAVADRGPGIPEAERAHVFEPFYRLDPSRNRASGGTGLGLAIVSQIVARHLGRVEIADRPGGGAVFTVTLPRAGPDASAHH